MSAQTTMRGTISIRLPGFVPVQPTTEEPAPQPHVAAPADAARPRIVFCISGQLRDEHVSFPMIAAQAEALEAVVIISTWRRRGTKSAGIINLDQADRMFGRYVAESLPAALLGNRTFEKTFPQFESLLAQSCGSVEPQHLLAYFPDAIIDIEDEVMHLGFADPDVADKNSLRMLYKIWRCNEIKRAVERDRGVVFDAVVRLRPDTIPELDASLLDIVRDKSFPRSIFIPHYKPDIASLDDVLAVSASAVADQMAALFGRAVMSDREGWDLIHKELWRHVQRLGLAVKPLQIGQWIAGDFGPHQQRNRALLLDLLTDGMFERDRFERESTWSAVRHLVTAAALFSDNAPLPEVSASLLQVDLLGEDAEFVVRTARLYAHACAAASRDEALYLAGLICLVCHRSRPDQVLSEGAARELAHLVVDAALPIGVPYAFSPASFAEVAQRLQDDAVSVHLLKALHHFVPHEAIANSLAAVAQHISVDSTKYVIAGWGHLGAGRLILARRIAVFLMSHHAQDWRGLDLLGHCYEREGKLDQAILCARQAYAMDPSHGGLAMRLGELLVKQERHEEALGHLRQGSMLWQTWRSACALADLLQRLDLTDEAAAAISTARTRLAAETGETTNPAIDEVASR
jgi:tetratricopeptide (TPR) repeat protein